MYGRQVTDTLTNITTPGRRKYDLHPYGKAGSGVMVLVTYVDSTTKERYILLSRKYANHTNKSKGLADQFILSGGYMKPHPLEGGEVNIEKITDDDKDRAEEAILLNQDGYNQASTYGNSHLLKQLSSEPTYDIDLEHTAIREFKEETGLEWDIKNGYPVHLSTRSAYGVTNDKRLYTIVAAFLLDYKELEHAPFTKAGSDIGEVIWVKLSDIIKNPKISPQKYGSKISRYSINLNETTYYIQDANGAEIEAYASTLGIIL